MPALRVLKLDHKGVVGDRALQPHKLIEAVIGYDAIAFGVGVHSMIFSRSLAIDGHAKANRFAVAGPEYKMQIAGMKTERNLAAGGVQYGELIAIEPSAGERPLVQAKKRWLRIELLHVSFDPAGGGKVVGACIADVGLGRAYVAFVCGSLNSLAMNDDRWQAWVLRAPRSATAESIARTGRSCPRRSARSAPCRWRR